MTEEYLLLFTAVSNAIDALRGLKAALVAAQQAAEEAYISRGED